MEFNVAKVTIPERIEWNYEELKKEIAERVQTYETIVYTDETIKEAKADRANLRKLAKALNDERIRLEKEYMKPFTEFKAQVNEVIGIIDKPVAIIDAQIKRAEEEKKREKEEEIRGILALFTLPYEIDPNRLFSEKWLNASVSMASIKKEIDEKVSKIQDDLKTLEGLTEFRDEAINAYTKSLDLRDALAEQQRAKETAEKIARWHEEQRAKAAEKTDLPDVTVDLTAPPAAPEYETKTEGGMWLNFRVCVNLEQAKALRKFFEIYGIQYERIDLK